MSNAVSGDPDEECDLDRFDWCSELDKIVVTPENELEDNFWDDDNGGLYPPQPGTQDCEVQNNCGGSGGSGGGGDGDGDDDPEPCDGDNPPLYCQCEDTGNVVFDNQTFKMGLEDLWNKQLDSNEEQGSFFYQNELTGDWQFFELIEPWVKRQTLTRLEFSVPSGLPEGSIYIHTHPTRSSLENYGITNEYIHGPSDDDRAAIVDMNNKHGVEYGVIIDPDYRILFGSDGNEITREDRCGY